MKKILMAAACVLFGISFTCQAQDSYSIEAGDGNMATLLQLALRKPWDSDFPILNEHHIQTFYTISVAEIVERKYQDVSGLQHTLTDIGFTPVLRWQVTAPHGLYAELGIGINYMNEKYHNNGRNMSSDFQFGDHIGIGYVFDSNLDLNLNFQHFSDAGIRMPNPAVNFVNIRLGWRF